MADDAGIIVALLNNLPEKISRKKELRIKFEDDFYYLVFPDGKELKFRNEEEVENAIEEYSKRK